MSTEKHTCEKQIYPGSGWGRGHSCGRTATLEHNGGWYCKTHHPPTVKAKFEARCKTASAEWESKAAAEREMRADHARMEALADHKDGHIWQCNLAYLVERFPLETDLRSAIDSAIDQWMKERTATK